jgi:DNA-binding NtrC family response regulator
MSPTPTEKGRLLVVDDDQSVVDYVVEMLASEGYAVLGTASPKEALTRVSTADFDLVIADIEMAEMRGTELLTAIHAKKPGQLVLLITAFGSIDLAVATVRAGACDFITKPFKIEVLLLAVERALRERRMRREIVRLRSSLPPADSHNLVAKSPTMRRVVEAAVRVARTGFPVLITGESGVGKGIVARLIHDQSARASGPFVAVNCAALPAPLVESELFGVRKGAFTDAREDRDGLFASATGGTVLLDEIAEMAIESQPKLLQVLETQRIRPVGGDREVDVDVRVIAATNRPLEDALRERRFRPDLYYRLNVIRLDVPPLRERPEDIEALVDLFLQRSSTKVDRPVMGVSIEAMQWLRLCAWPGNVRELMNVIERAVALTEHDTIVVDDLAVAAETAPANADFLAGAAARRVPLAQIEQAYIRRVLELTKGNKALAARILDIDRRTLYRRLGEEEPAEQSVPVRDT